MESPISVTNTYIMFKPLSRSKVRKLFVPKSFTKSKSYVKFDFDPNPIAEQVVELVPKLIAKPVSKPIVKC